MFEQSTIDINGRRWTVAASLTMQSAVTGFVLLISIWSIDALPGVSLSAPLPPVPAAPRPVEIVSAEVGRTASKAPALTPRTFTAPARIPQRIVSVIDEPGAAPMATADPGLRGTGLPGGLFPSGGLSPNLGSFGHVPPPPPPPTRISEPDAPKTVRLGGHVLEGKLVRRVMPEYPALARNMRVSGAVSLHGTIARDGSVRNLKVLSGHPLLVQAALAAVRQWLYAPTLLNGEPVEVSAPIQVHFKLDGGR